ncbi:MAG TPA: MFS transporter, partial [Syntrophales bacterium]|nr:MFS transporter [Syntrophales bacterium]
MITAVCVYASVYAPQPILPLLAGEYGLTTSGGALLMTAVLLPLSFAPLFYGLLLESQPAKRMLLIAIGILTLLQAAFGAAESYGLLIAARLLQGVCVPAILAALTSYLAYTVDREHIQRAMTWYVAANILGG